MCVNVYINTKYHDRHTCTWLTEFSAVEKISLVADGVVDHTAVGIIQTLDLQT